MLISIRIWETFSIILLNSYFTTENHEAWALYPYLHPSKKKKKKT